MMDFEVPLYAELPDHDNARLGITRESSEISMKHEKRKSRGITRTEEPSSRSPTRDMSERSMNFGLRGLTRDLSEMSMNPHRSRDLSELSMNLDDITDMPDSMRRDLPSFSLACWGEQDEQDGSAVSKITHPNRSGSNFFDIVDGLSEQESDGYIKGMKDGESKPKWLDWEDFPDDGRERKVHFSIEFPEEIEIERVDLEDYPLVYYGTHELQKMADEYRLEEEEARRGTIR